MGSRIDGSVSGTFSIDGHKASFSGFSSSSVLFDGYVTVEDESSAPYFMAPYVVDGEEQHHRYPYSGVRVILNRSNMSIVEPFKLSNSDGSKVKGGLNRRAFAIFGSVLAGLPRLAVPAFRTDKQQSFSADAPYVYNTPIGSMVLQNGSLISADVSSSVQYLKSTSFDVELKLERSDKFTRLPHVYDKSSITLKWDWLNKFLRPADMGIADNVTSGYLLTVEQVMERYGGIRNYDWLFKQNYQIVAPDKVKECVEYLRANRHQVISFDTETTGLDVTVHSRSGDGDTLVGMVFSVKPGESFYFPVAHRSFPNIADTPEGVEYLIETLFKPMLEEEPILAHNSGFDWRVMHVYGIDTNIVADTMLLYRMTLANDSSYAGINAGLKPLTAKFLNRDSFELSDFSPTGKWDNSISFQDMPYESARLYACADTDNTLTLFYRLLQMGVLEEYNAHGTFQLESTLQRVIGYSQFYGMYIRPEEVAEIRKHYETQRDEGLREMMTMRKERAISLGTASESTPLEDFIFNPGSDVQLGKVFFDEMGLPVLVRTAKGNRSLNKTAKKLYMEKTDMDGNALYPIVGSFSKWHDANYLLSSFLNKTDVYLRNSTFHSDIDPMKNTGRMSSKDPNYQGMDDVMKRAIIGRPGYYSADADFSSIETRVMSSMAGEMDMVNNFFDPDFDSHRYTASLVFNTPFELVTSKQRKMAKVFSFGIPYGLSPQGFAEKLFGTATPENVAKASELIDAFYRGMPKMKSFFDDIKDKAVVEGFNATFFGRRRYYGEIKDRKTEGKVRRQAGNLPIQGTAADIFKRSVINIFFDLKKRGYLGKVLISGFVHDEIVLEVHNSIDPAEIVGILQQCMMLKIRNWCPLYIGCGFGHSWYEAKSTELPVQVQNKMVASGIGYEWDGDIDRFIERERVLIDTQPFEYLRDWCADPAHAGVKPSSVIKAYVSSAVHLMRSGDEVEGVGVFDPVSLPEAMSFEASFRAVAEFFGFVPAFESAGLDFREDSPAPSADTADSAPSVLSVARSEEEELQIAFESAYAFGASMVSDSVVCLGVPENPAEFDVLRGLIAQHLGTCKVLAVYKDKVEFLKDVYVSSYLPSAVVRARNSGVLTAPSVSVSA